MRTLLVFLLLTSVAYAEDFVRYDPATGAYLGCQSYGNTTIPLTNPNDLTAVRSGFLYANPLCANVLPGVPDRYRKVVNSVVVEMTQAEKDAVDAPALAEAAKQAAFDAELSTNDACNADMDVLEARIDAAYQNASTVAQVKSVTAAIMKKLARCIRARAR